MLISVIAAIQLISIVAVAIMVGVKVSERKKEKRKEDLSKYKDF